MDAEKTETIPATVTITGRGPIRIEGHFEIIDQNGAKRIVDNETVKICGCGRSAEMPICDGAHKR